MTRRQGRRGPSYAAPHPEWEGRLARVEEGFRSIRGDLEAVRADLNILVSRISESQRTNWGTLAAFGGLILAFGAALFSPYAISISKQESRLYEYPALVEKVITGEGDLSDLEDRFRDHELMDAHPQQRERQERTEQALSDHEARLRAIEQSRFTREDWQKERLRPANP